MADKKPKLKKRELYTVVNGRQTDATLHNIDDDYEWRKAVNERYNTVKIKK